MIDLPSFRRLLICHFGCSRRQKQNQCYSFLFFEVFRLNYNLLLRQLTEVSSPFNTTSIQSTVSFTKILDFLAPEVVHKLYIYFNRAKYHMNNVHGGKTSDGETSQSYLTYYFRWLIVECFKQISYFTFLFCHSISSLFPACFDMSGLNFIGKL